MTHYDKFVLLDCNLALYISVRFSSCWSLNGAWEAILFLFKIVTNFTSFCQNLTFHQLAIFCILRAFIN